VLEWTLRTIAAATLLVLLVRAIRPPAAPRSAAVGPAARDRLGALAAWTSAPAPESVVVRMDGAPAPDERDWWRALRGAGSVVRWSAAAPLPALAVSVMPVVDPGTRAAVSVRVGAPAGSLVAVVDAGSPAYPDSVRSAARGGGGGSITLPAAQSGVVATLGATRAMASAPDSLIRRPVLVLGRAGWEGKFAIAALEERGWTVRARLTVSPAAEVRAGGDPPPLDTANWSAVVVLDSSITRQGPAIARYVRAGGGLVLAGEAARAPAFAGLLAGQPGARRPGIAGALVTATPRRALTAMPIARLVPDAVPLERREGTGPGTVGEIIVAARRVAAGRVVQAGYLDTWRWRMGGGDAGAAGHRAWWSGLVRAVAYAPEAGAAREPAGEGPGDAPVARLVAALGAAVPWTESAPPVPAGAPGWPAFLLIVLALGGEWLSRRLRGRR
jgi:hypothetical protein